VERISVEFGNLFLQTRSGRFYRGKEINAVEIENLGPDGNPALRHGLSSVPAKMKNNRPGVRPHPRNLKDYGDVNLLRYQA
jgi:hypothetical protein